VVVQSADSLDRLAYRALGKVSDIVRFRALAVWLERTLVYGPSTARIVSTYTDSLPPEIGARISYCIPGIFLSTLRLFRKVLWVDLGRRLNVGLGRSDLRDRLSGLGQRRVGTTGMEKGETTYIMRGSRPI
jgi:hypothetical protein